MTRYEYNHFNIVYQTFEDLKVQFDHRLYPYYSLFDKLIKPLEDILAKDIGKYCYVISTNPTIRRTPRLIKNVKCNISQLCYILENDKSEGWRTQFVHPLDVELI